MFLLFSVPPCVGLAKRKVFVQLLTKRNKKEKGQVFEWMKERVVKEREKLHVYIIKEYKINSKKQNKASTELQSNFFPKEHKKNMFLGM